MNLSKIQKAASEQLAEAMRLFAQAQDKLRLANRFAVEPEIGTVVMFDKEFPNSNAALEAAGLNFDPAKLIPNVTPAGLTRLAEVAGVGRTTSMVILDQDTFDEVQRTTYRYVAIRVGDVWYTTAARGNKMMTWDKLIEFIGDSQCWVAETWREIPVETPEVEAADDVEDEDAVAATLADVLGKNRKQAMAALQKLNANGKRPTPKTIIDTLAKIGAESK